MNVSGAARTVGLLALYVGVFIGGGVVLKLLGLPNPAEGIVFSIWIGLVFTGIFIREAGWDYIDLRTPTKADAFVAAIALVAYYAFFIAGTLTISHFAPSVESPGHSALEKEMTTTYIVGLFVLAVVITPPVEELVFRNGLQKALTGWLNGPIAIVATSAVFAGIHYWSYAGGDTQLVGLAVTLGLIFANSILIGGAYWWTDNLVVPVAIHGVINAVGVSAAVLGF